MNPDQTDIADGIQDQINEYKKLQDIADDQNFSNFFDLQLKTVAEKLLWGLLTHQEPQGGTVDGKPIVKNVDNIENWDQFCRWRGEVIARLQPIQEVYGADHMINYLKQQLDQYKQN